MSREATSTGGAKTAWPRCQVEPGGVTGVRCPKRPGATPHLGHHKLLQIHPRPRIRGAAHHQQSAQHLTAFYPGDDYMSDEESEKRWFPNWTGEMDDSGDEESSDDEGL